MYIFTLAFYAGELTPQLARRFLFSSQVK